MERQPDNQREIGAEASDQKATESYRLAIGSAMVATANDALRHTEYMNFDAHIRALNLRLTDHGSGWSTNSDFPHSIHVQTSLADMGYGIYEPLFDNHGVSNVVADLDHRLQALERAVDDFCTKNAQFKQEQSSWEWDESRQMYLSWFPQGNYWMCSDGTKIYPK
ncbi:hypothetical protein SLS57_010014 [Botryosphaeria dothidea]